MTGVPTHIVLSRRRPGRSYRTDRYHTDAVRAVLQVAPIPYGGFGWLDLQARTGHQNLESQGGCECQSLWPGGHGSGHQGVRFGSHVE
jgi:hypothetical protein